jgi:hypothetical protein
MRMHGQTEGQTHDKVNGRFLQFRKAPKKRANNPFHVVINKIYDVCVFFFTHKVLYGLRF